MVLDDQSSIIVPFLGCRGRAFFLQERTVQNVLLKLAKFKSLRLLLANGTKSTLGYPGRKDR